MIKEVKEFIEMMHNLQKWDRVEWEQEDSFLNRGCLCRSNFIVRGVEFQALEATVEKEESGPKIEVTDELVSRAHLAASNWICDTFPNGEEKYPHFSMIRAALEAVFASIAPSNDSERPNSSQDDWIALEPNNPLLNLTRVVQVKYKKGDEHSTGIIRAENYLYPYDLDKGVAVAYRFIAEQSADNDGWIEWSGGECPVPAGSKCEVKFRGGGIVGDRSPENWSWQYFDGHGCIIAYRLIEPKEEKKKSEEIAFVDGLSFKRWVDAPKAKLEMKKIYKLSDMWKGWVRAYTGYCQTACFHDKGDIIKYYPHEKFVAITRADAIEFYEGEGLEDLKK